MQTIRIVVGWLLIGISGLAVIQTARAIALWEIAAPRYIERSRHENTITFAGRTVEVVDNLPHTASGSQETSEGRLGLRLDGRLEGEPSRTAIRIGLSDLGRYHGWFAAWMFTAKSDGDSSLWLARRLQMTAREPVRFQLVVVHSDGVVASRVVRGWHLAFDYRSFRSTQFVRSSEWEVLPLDLSGVAGLLPVLLLVFPVATMVGGIVLLRWSRSVAPAV